MNTEMTLLQKIKEDEDDLNSMYYNMILNRIEKTFDPILEDNDSAIKLLLKKKKRIIEMVNVLESCYKDRWDIEVGKLSFNIFIFYDSISLENNNGLHHTVNELIISYSYIFSSKKYEILGGSILAKRAVYTPLEYEHNYKHSHLSITGPNEYASICFSEEVNSICFKENINISDYYYAFLLNIENSLGTEDLEGGPHILFEKVTGSINNTDLKILADDLFVEYYDIEKNVFKRSIDDNLKKQININTFSFPKIVFDNNFKLLISSMYKNLSDSFKESHKKFFSVSKSTRDTIYFRQYKAKIMIIENNTNNPLVSMFFLKVLLNKFNLVFKANLLKKLKKELNEK